MESVLTLTAAVVQDGDRYAARCLEIEVASQGRSVDEALVNLREALELYFADSDVTTTVERHLVTPIEIRVRA